MGQSQTGPTLCKIRVKRGVGGDSFASKRQALTVAAMWLLAVTTLEKLKAVPTKFWVNLVLALVAGVVAIVLVRHAARMNRLVLALIVFLLLTVVGFQWIYERNEPQFMTPFVEKVAPFFPSKPHYRGGD